MIGYGLRKLRCITVCCCRLSNRLGSFVPISRDVMGFDVYILLVAFVDERSVVMMHIRWMLCY